MDQFAAKFPRLQTHATDGGKPTKQRWGRLMTGIDRRTVLKAGALAALSGPFAAALTRPTPVSASPLIAPWTAAGSDPAVVGSWSEPFDMGGIAIHAALTHVGDVLFFGDIGDQAGSPELYVGTWNYATGAVGQAPLGYDRDLFCAGLNVLADGRVFVAGGHLHPSDAERTPENWPTGVADTDTYDPVARRWTSGPDLSEARWYPTSLTMPDNTVLIFGGQVGMGTPSDTVDMYDPAANTVTRLPASATRPVGLYPRMHLMPNGDVLKSGPPRTSAYFSRSTNAWTNSASMTFGARVRGHSVLLPGATRVLHVGGQSDGGTPPTGTAEVLDTSAKAPKWTATGSLNHPRILGNTVVLPDGKVIIIGGGAQFKYKGPVYIPELWDPANGRWIELPPHQASRMYHSVALLLPDGRVLSAGQDFGPLETTGEIYSPPYLFKGPRPTIASAPSEAGYGQQLSISTPEAADIASVVLIRPGCLTHQIDTDQRSLPLKFTAGSGTITAQTPPNAQTAPPGYYMLFILNSAGVPSVAPWVHLG